jgi:hypothetical protein
MYNVNFECIMFKALRLHARDSWANRVEAKSWSVPRALATIDGTRTEKPGLDQARMARGVSVAA